MTNGKGNYNKDMNANLFNHKTFAVINVRERKLPSFIRKNGFGCSKIVNESKDNCLLFILSEDNDNGKLKGFIRKLKEQYPDMTCLTSFEQEITLETINESFNDTFNKMLSDPGVMGRMALKKQNKIVEYDEIW